MKGKLLGEVAVQFDRLQQQQRLPVRASSTSPFQSPPRASGCPPAHLRLAFPSPGAEGGDGQALPQHLRCRSRRAVGSIAAAVRHSIIL